MAIILPASSPPLETLILSLRAPGFLPAQEGDASKVLPAELARWHLLLDDTLQHLDELGLDELSLDQWEALSVALARWDVREGGMEAEQELDGWVLSTGAGTRIQSLLDRLPPPSLVSLRPLFAARPPPQISLTSSRPLVRPIVDDSVPDVEPWKTTAGWGCWNVLRRGIESLDDSEAPPLGLFLPPLLTLVDDTAPVFRLRGLWALKALLNKCASARASKTNVRGWGGPWLAQTGIGELLLKSLNLLLHAPSGAFSPQILSATMTVHLLATSLTFGPNTEKRTRSVDELVERGIVGTWIYRQGAEDGDAAREIAKWLARQNHETGLLEVLGSTGVIRLLGVLLPSLLLPLTTLSPSSKRSLPFILDLLLSIRHLVDVASRDGADRVAAWRGKVLGSLGRLWVGLMETESLQTNDAPDLTEPKARIVQVLAIVARSHPAFIETEVPSLVQLDVRIFEPLLREINRELSRTTSSSLSAPSPLSM